MLLPDCFIMANNPLQHRSLRTSYLNIHSNMDVKWETAEHNPADLSLSLPNSIRTNKIWKVLPHTLVVPRMFPNIYAPDNRLLWYQRQVVELPTAVPDRYLRTVSPVWTVTRSLELPTDMWNVEKILAAINAVTGVNEVWTYDSDLQCFVITATPSGPPVVFGYFDDPGHVEPAVTYASMTYVVEPIGTHLFSPLGLEKTASLMTLLPLSPVFVPDVPSTFDNLLGSNISGRNAFPLFDRSAHSYAIWGSNEYVTSRGNPPNLAGPVIVHVSIGELGDSSTVDAETGLVQDIITTINLGDVEFGTWKERLGESGEGVEYQQARNISSFRVRLLDSRNRQLVLPRNFPIFLKLQMVHGVD